MIKVLIVGAGVGGLALAGRLITAGADVEVVEKSRAFGIGTGIYLPGNAVRAMADLGIADEVTAAGRINQRRRYLSSDGKSLFEVDVEDFWHDVAPPIGVHRSELHKALVSRAEGASIHMGTTVTDLAQDGSSVTVDFSDGRGDVYDLVVGADGVHSMVRELVFGQGAERRASLGAVSWRGVVRNDWDIDAWTVWTGRESVLLTVPIDFERVYVFSSTSSDLRAGHRWRAEHMAALFDEFVSPVTDIVKSLNAVPEDIFFSLLDEVEQSPWQRGRVVLIGDAAHAMAPTMAQGAALAMEDALVLSELLASESDPEWAIQTFEERRRPRVEWVRDHTERQASLLRLPFGIRNLSAGLIGRRLWERSFSLLRNPY
jgi:2-polyprenyl-6-methoxyphenol hydroxylase-like FAD-dependent oxidoreductase